MNGDNEDNVNSSFSSLTGTTTVTILLSKRFVRTISIREQRQEAGDILTSSQDKNRRFVLEPILFFSVRRLGVLWVTFTANI